MSDAITLRSHLLGSLNDLVESAELGVLGKCSIVCELVSLFADYQEEGTPLFLDAYLTDDLGRLTAMIPQSTCLRLGSAQFDEAGIKSAVKKAAPLVRGCWRMYLSGNGKDFEFGLFRDSGHPLNVPIDMTLQDVGSGGAKFIRITKLVQDAVKVSVHKGKELVVNFTNAKDGVAELGQSIGDLCQLVCEGLDKKRAQSCETYLTYLLSKGIRESHGALIAVTKSKKVPAFLRDCIALDPPLDFSETIESVRRDSAIIPQLQALESLICGMLCCDGIVIFNTKAQVLAYNGFIKLKTSNVIGGARRRAYDGLCNKLGKGLSAAFVQSRDGMSELRRTK